MGPDRTSGPAGAGSGSGGIEGFERLAPPLRSTADFKEAGDFIIDTGS